MSDTPVEDVQDDRALLPVEHKGTSVSQLAEGDRVRISATHQVKIDGLDAWVKIEVDSAVRADEDATKAMARVGKTIAANMVNEIERQAEVVFKANRRQLETQQPY